MDSDKTLFTLIPAGNKDEYYIKTSFDEYLTPLNNGKIDFTKTKGISEKFKLGYGKDGNVRATSFKASNGYYLCCEEDGRIIANRREVKLWETFTMIDY